MPPGPPAFDAPVALLTSWLRDGRLSPTVAAALERLLDHCRTLIAGYKVPKQIEVTDTPLPKSGAGKVLKRELREPHWEGRDTRIG